MGKVDDLRAMREARYNAAARTVKASAPVTGSSAPGSGAKTSTATKPAKTARLRVVTEVETVHLPEPNAAVPGATEPGAAEPAALFAVQAPADEEPQVLEELCGHRAISGKTCIRENKHAEKNHKYAKS